MTYEKYFHEVRRLLIYNKSKQKSNPISSDERKYSTMASPLIPKEASMPQTLALQASLPATMYFIFRYIKCLVIYLGGRLPTFSKTSQNIKQSGIIFSKIKIIAKLQLTKDDMYTYYLGQRNLAYYTKYHIYCHMVLNVTIVTFWMTLLMNK